MHWLITGGVGFIGFHLSRALLSHGDTVTVVDDFSNAPYPTLFKRRNQADLKNEFGAAITIEEACVTNRDRLEPIVKRAEGIVHLAGLAGVRPSFRAPARYSRVNVEGTATVLDLAAAVGIERVLFASSSSVYGNSTPLPAKEEAPAIVPESPYAASKRAAELIAQSMVRNSKTLSCSALRFFTVYGPRQRPEMAITLFARTVLGNKPIEVFGDGSMRRDFTHVDDIVRGILATMEKAPKGYSVYNLGSGAPVTLSDLVTGLEIASKTRIEVQYAPVPAGDVEATFADISKAKKELGWVPQIKLQDGLETVLNWVRTNADPR